MSIIQRNYEFLYYIAVVAPMIFIAILYHKKLHLTVPVLLGLTILGFLHMVGGHLSIFGTRIYDLWLISNIFRYDNLMHAFGIFVITFIAYSILSPHLDKKIHHNKILLSIMFVSIAMGLGAINEVLELGAFFAWGAVAGVGDYLNNAIDLFYNLVGSIVACFFILRYHTKKFK